MEWIQSLKGLKLGGKSKRRLQVEEPQTQTAAAAASKVEDQQFGSRRRKSSLSSSLRSKFRLGFGSSSSSSSSGKRRQSLSAEWEKESQFEAKLRRERYQALGDQPRIRCQSQIITSEQEQDALMPMRQESLLLEQGRRNGKTCSQHQHQQQQKRTWLVKAPRVS